MCECSLIFRAYPAIPAASTGRSPLLTQFSSVDSVVSIGGPYMLCRLRQDFGRNSGACSGWTVDRTRYPIRRLFPSTAIAIVICIQPSFCMHLQANGGGVRMPWNHSEWLCNARLASMIFRRYPLNATTLTKGRETQLSPRQLLTFTIPDYLQFSALCRNRTRPRLHTAAISGSTARTVLFAGLPNVISFSSTIPNTYG